MLQRCFPLFCALLFQPFYQFPICAVLTCDGSWKLVARFAEFKGIVSVNVFWFHWRFWELKLAFFAFFAQFLFCMGKIMTIELSNFVPHQSVDDFCGDSFPSSGNIVFRSYEITKIFRSGDCTNTFPARSTCYVRLQQMSQIKTREMIVNFMLGSAFVRGSILDSWQELEVSRCQRHGFHRNLEGPDSSTLWTIKQFMAEGRFVLLRVFHFHFRMVLVSVASFPAALHSYFHFFRTLDFRCVRWRQMQNPIAKILKKYAWMSMTLHEGGASGKECVSEASFEKQTFALPLHLSLLSPFNPSSPPSPTAPAPPCPGGGFAWSLGVSTEKEFVRRSWRCSKLGMRTGRLACAGEVSTCFCSEAGNQRFGPWWWRQCREDAECLIPWRGWTALAPPWNCVQRCLGQTHKTWRTWREWFLVAKPQTRAREDAIPRRFQVDCRRVFHLIPPNEFVRHVVKFVRSESWSRLMCLFR